MPNYNKVILMGHLTRDPELNYTPNKTAVVEFGLAVNRVWKDDSGQDHKEVAFVELYAFSRNAENINKYTRKGDALHVEGRLMFQSWEANDGSKRSRLKVLIERFQFCTVHRKRDSSDQQPGSPKLSPANEDIPF